MTTVTSTLPATWAGVTAVSVVLVTLVADTVVPPNLTAKLAPLVNPLPVIVTGVPPAVVPARGLREFVASVNVVSPCSKELCPSATNFNVAPDSSSSFGTIHVAEIFPFSLAVAYQGACASLVSLSPATPSCNTCNFTDSPGRKPEPVISTVSPGE